MKKIFSFIAALMAVVAVNAAQVVFDFTNPEGLGITAPAAGAGTNITDAVVYQGVTMTATNGSTATRVWNSSGVYDLRVYKNGTLTFAAEEAITAIEFAGKNINLSEISGKSWTGSATSVKFTATATCNINTVKVYVGEEVVVWTPDTVSVSEAIALVGNNDSHDHFVKGVVMGAPFITYANFGGKASFWLADETNANDSIELYDGLGVNGAKWATLYEAQSTVLVGDTVLVYAGALSLYTAKNFYEITGGYYVETLGHNPDAVVPEEPVEVAPDTITVAEALAIGNALEDNKSTDVEYVVAGYAHNPKGPNEGYTDQTWYMADEPGAYGEFSAYQCEPDRLVEEGDYMLVRGKILKYVGSFTTIEISRGTAVHGEAPEIIAIEVSVAEALEIAQALTPELKKSETTAETYAVKGFIVNVKDAEKKTYYMADEADAYGVFQAFKCASVDYEVAKGDLVIVTGKISTYHGQNDNGEEYYNYEISGGALKHVNAQGLGNVEAAGKAQKVLIDGVVYILRDGKMFNTLGTQVR